MSNRFLVKIGVRDEAENLPLVLDALLRLRERRVIDQRRLRSPALGGKRSGCDRRVVVLDQATRRCFDVLVIDDASCDHTVDIVMAHSLPCIRHEVRRGISFATREALQYALAHDYDACVMLDGDGQHDPTKVTELFVALEAGVQLAQCTRYASVTDRRRTPLDRDLMRAAVVGMLRDYVGWEPLTDPFCGFWGMRREIIEYLLPQMKGPAYDDADDGGYGIAVEILLRLWAFDPRPKRAEISHPAIYQNGSARLEQRYRSDRLEDRLGRLVIHTRRIMEVVRDLGLDHRREKVATTGVNGVDHRKFT